MVINVARRTKRNLLHICLCTKWYVPEDKGEGKLICKTGHSTEDWSLNGKTGHSTENWSFSGKTGYSAEK